MIMNSTEGLLNAQQIAEADFDRVHRQAIWEHLVATLLGRKTHLSDFNELGLETEAIELRTTLEEIPLDQIVGSVGRAQDYTASFLPLKAADKTRWSIIKAAVVNMKGMLPVELYQVGDEYFVLDGNHRVSVSRHIGSPSISAYVTRIG